MLKIVVLIYMNRSGEISLPFYAKQGVNLNANVLLFTLSVFYTVVCHQNFKLTWPYSKLLVVKHFYLCQIRSDHCDNLFPI